MEIYISALLISLVFAFLAITAKRVEGNVGNAKIINTIVYKFLAVCSFLPLFLVSAVRYGLGTDYFYRYVPGFLSVESGHNGGYEIGFYLINKIVAICTSNYQWLFVLTSVLICGFIYLAIYEQSEYILLSIILFVITTTYFISMNVVRQSVAVAIFLYALKYAINRDIKKYFIFILIAALIHMSAFIYFPIYFLFNKKIKTHIIVSIISILCMPFIYDIFIYILSFTKYIGYFHTAFNKGVFDYWSFIINLGILLFGYAFYKKLKNDRKYMVMLNLQFITVELLLFSAVIPLISRAILCFTFTQILFIPFLLSKIESKMIRNLLKLVVVGLYGFYLIHTIVIKGYQQVLPYHSIFG
ncbi:EpsG family protein [uncultured Clostridium sp.]|uniref:EpsG family protein n=1 Tax=uncultured Clostridium sp. TaxID=59620 RepID=UPI0026318A71|nr:EpsG family protein [uncultured Clostridium sp.]